MAGDQQQRDRVAGAGAAEQGLGEGLVLEWGGGLELPAVLVEGEGAGACRAGVAGEQGDAVHTGP